MKNIKNLELVESQITNWKSQDIAFIKELHYCGCFEEEDGSQNSRLTLITLSQPRTTQWPIFENDFLEIIIDFNTIKEFKINYNGSGDIQVIGLEITDLRDSHLEDIKMHVFDYEMDRISFYAESASIKSCKKVKPIIRTSPITRTYKIR